MEETSKIGSGEPKSGGAFGRVLKRILTILLILIIGGMMIWAWYIRERIADIHLEETMKEEVSRVESRLDERGNAIETKLYHFDSKLDRVEGKLDRLLYLLEPRLPDGMSQVE